MRYRSVWISDVHLGLADCQANALLEFLRQHPSDNLYLVGDLIDFWMMPRNRRWPSAHSELLRTLLQRAEQGCRVVYIPGNHDELLHSCSGLFLAGIEVQPYCEHVTADNQRLLICHGDQFDLLIRHNAVLEWIGYYGYDALLMLGRGLHWLRQRLGYHNHWSLAAAVKQQLGQVARHVERFQNAALHEAQRQGYDGIICGHIHVADLQERDGLIYGNCGDWVESTSALVEHYDGHLELRYAQASPPLRIKPRRYSVAAYEQQIAPHASVSRP